MTQLGLNFPSIVLGPEFGRWWRIHSQDYGPWFFASDSPQRDQASIGRFDLAAPLGTCYLGDDLAASLSESLRVPGVDALDAQSAADKRRLSSMPLDRWYGKRIADFTSDATRFFGAASDIARLDRAAARPFARAAHEAGFEGVLYRLREDPRHRLGLALFGAAGEHPAVEQPFAAPIPAGLRNELKSLFGEYRGDPLAY